MVTEPTPHDASLAVWGVPATVPAGERFQVTVGARSAASYALGGGRIEVTGAGATSDRRLGGAPWPGSEALYFTELTLHAPDRPGRCAFSVRFDPAGVAEPHREARASFDVVVVAVPQHTLTVKVAAGDAPVESAHIRLGPYRATTGADGVATLRVAAGCYDLIVWRAGYDTPSRPLELAADTAVHVEAAVQPEDEPDARWTA